MQVCRVKPLTLGPLWYKSIPPDYTPAAEVIRMSINEEILNQLPGELSAKIPYFRS
jgi:hypothetical protein